MNQRSYEIGRQLDQVVSGIFATMMERRCVPACADAACEHSAAVDFSGGVRGRCVLAMGADDATAYVRLMLGGHDDVSEDMRRDAVGELCNMIAGGWKSLQTAAVEMSTPRLDMGCCAEECLRRCYEFDGSRFAVEMRVAA